MVKTSCTPEEAVERGRRALSMGGQYRLGTGDYRPRGGLDEPWTGTPPASDCAGFAICYAWKLQRHRPGFNVGPWATVSHDINTDSALEDAEHKSELFHVVQKPEPGDLLVYSSIRRAGKRIRIGHVGLVETVGDWDVFNPNYTSLTVLQSHGPGGRAPGVVRTDGRIWSRNDFLWPKPEHRTRVLRVRYG